MAKTTSATVASIAPTIAVTETPIANNGHTNNIKQILENTATATHNSLVECWILNRLPHHIGRSVTDNLAHPTCTLQGRFVVSNMRHTTSQKASNQFSKVTWHHLCEAFSCLPRYILFMLFRWRRLGIAKLTIGPDRTTQQHGVFAQLLIRKQV